MVVVTPLIHHGDGRPPIDTTHDDLKRENEALKAQVRALQIESHERGVRVITLAEQRNEQRQREANRISVCLHPRDAVALRAIAAADREDVFLHTCQLCGEAVVQISQDQPLPGPGTSHTDP